MPSVKVLALTLDDVNAHGTFSEGDTLSGTVTLVLHKEVTVQSLYVKAKGDASVHWTEKRGDNNRTYSANKRFFKLKHFLVGTQDSKDIAVPRGSHSYKFSFRLPGQAMPSSFRGSHGKIVYKVEVVLSRSWRLDSTAEKEIKFFSRCYSNLPFAMSPRVGSVTKEMGLFSRGKVKMDVSFDRGAYAPGEMVMIVAVIDNTSSSDVTLKFNLRQDVVFRASGDRKSENNTILKIGADCIRSNTKKEVQCALQIPPTQILSIQNCGIITVDYYIKASLDISFAFDPEVKLPITIIPKELVRALQSARSAGPHPAGATGGPSRSDFPPTAPSMAVNPPPPQPYAPQPAYSNQPPGYAAFAPKEYPPQPPYMAGAYSNPVPSAPYGSPFSSSASTPVLHPPPSAPTYNHSPSAPAMNPFPSSSFNMSVPGPAPNSLASAPTMDLDFLSTSDEPPPSYSVLFPSSAPENSGPN